MSEREVYFIAFIICTFVLAILLVVISISMRQQRIEERLQVIEGRLNGLVSEADRLWFPREPGPVHVETDADALRSLADAINQFNRLKNEEVS